MEQTAVFSDSRIPTAPPLDDALGGILRGDLPAAWRNRRPDHPARREEIDPHDIMEIRNSLKLCCKAACAAADALRASGDESRSRQCEISSAAAGFLLALGGEKRTLVAAAFVRDALAAFPELAGKIERSFGPDTLGLLTSGPGGGGRSIRDRTRLQQACAFGQEASRSGNVPAALRQYPVEMQGRYTHAETERILDALLRAASLYRGVTRSWGERERLPLLAHAADVGLLLALAHAPAEAVVAGILHDALEKYNVNGRSCAEIRGEIGRTFGARITALIDAVTEPRGGEPWEERKLRVVINVGALWEQDRELGRRAAMVLCASKASTIAGGNKRLYEGIRAGQGPEELVRRWSKSGHEENVLHFRQLRALFHITDVPAGLTAQFDEELARFETPGRISRNRSYAVAAG